MTPLTRASILVAGVGGAVAGGLAGAIGGMLSRSGPMQGAALGAVAGGLAAAGAAQQVISSDGSSPYGKASAAVAGWWA